MRYLLSILIFCVSAFGQGVSGTYPPTAQGAAGGVFVPGSAYPNPGGLTAQAVSAPMQCVDTGSVNAITCTNTAVTAYAAGLQFTVIPNHSNTGAATLRVNSLAALPVQRNGAALSGGEYLIGQPITMVCGVSACQIGAPGATAVGLGSVTNDAQTKAAVVPNTAPSAGQFPVGNAGGTAYAPVTMSGGATLGSTGALSLTAPGVAAALWCPGTAGSTTTAEVCTQASITACSAGLRIAFTPHANGLPSGTSPTLAAGSCTLPILSNEGVALPLGTLTVASQTELYVNAANTAWVAPPLVPSATGSVATGSLAVSNTLSATNVDRIGWGQIVFRPNADNPALGPVAIESSLDCISGTCTVWYHQAGYTVYKASATTATVKPWSSPVAVAGSYQGAYPFVFPDSGLYFMLDVDPSSGDLYLRSSSDGGSTFSTRNAGNPVLIHSASTASTHHVIYNTSLKVVGGVAYLMVETASGAGTPALTVMSASTAPWDPDSITFDANLTTLFPFGGGPDLHYVSTRSAFFALFHYRPSGGGAWQGRAVTVPLANFLQPSAWTISPYFGMYASKDITDLAMADVSGQGNVGNLLLQYNWDQTGISADSNSIMQAWSDLSAEQFYDAVAGSANTPAVTPVSTVYRVGNAAQSAQAASIATTVLYHTPTVGGAGIYRVALYYIVTQAATSSSSITPTVYWNDNIRNAQQDAPAYAGNVATGSNSVTQATFTFYAYNNTNISYSTTYASSGATPMQYSIWATVERVW
jgi:hypothetical protein